MVLTKKKLSDMKTKKQTLLLKNPPSSSTDEDSSEDSSEENEAKVAAPINGNMNGDGDSDSSEEEIEEEAVPLQKASSSESDSEDDDDVSEPVAKVVSPQKGKAGKKLVSQESNSDDDSSDEAPVKQGSLKANQSLKKADESSEEEEMEVDAQDTEFPKFKGMANLNVATPSGDAQRRTGVNVFCGNLDSGVTAGELRAFLTKRGVPVSGLTLSKRPFAIVEVANEADARRLQAQCQGARYKSSALTVLRLNGDVSGLVVGAPVAGNLAKTKLYVSNLAREADKESLSALIPNDLTPVKVDILMKRGSKFHRGAAIVEMESEEAATRTMEALNETELAGKKIRASYMVEKAVKQQESASSSSPQKETSGRQKSTNEQYRGKTRTILITQLPESINFAMVKEVFTTAKKVDLKKKGAQRNCFVEFETEQECENIMDTHQGTEIGGKSVFLVFVPHKDSSTRRPESVDASGPVGTTLSIYNLPFTMNEKALRGEFPNVSKIHMPKNNMGKSKGMCILNFSSEDDCRAVVEACKNKEIGGRKIRCEIGQDQARQDRQPFAQERTPRPQQQAAGRQAHMPDDCVMKVFNLPFTAQESDIRREFQKVTKVFMPKNDQGKPKGMAMLIFSSAADCQEALSSCSSKEMKGRQLRGELKGDPRQRPSSGTPNQFKRQMGDAATGSSYPKKIKFADDSDEDAGTTSKLHQVGSSSDSDTPKKPTPAQKKRPTKKAPPPSDSDDSDSD